MFGNKCMGFGHRLVSGYCSEGEHNIAVRLRANSSISTAQVPPLRGVEGIAVRLRQTEHHQRLEFPP